MRALSRVPRSEQLSTGADGNGTDQSVGSVLSAIARTLWPGKTAENLAVCANCSVRAAEYYLAGDRDWSGDAIAAIVGEILKRHSMRNVRIAARH